MQSLADQGLISDPKRRAESVRLTPEGVARAQALGDRLFGA
jgi:broad specificity phosphatase PhoE